MEVEFHYSLLADTLEEQANKYGLTLGKDAKLLQELESSLYMCWLEGICTDSQKAAMVKKLHKKVMGAITKLDGNDV